MENSRDILSLIKYIDDNGFLYDGNAVDTRITALLGSLTRNPNNERHWKLLWRILKPKMIAQDLINDPFTPYPFARDFSGEIRLGFVGLHEPYVKDEFDTAGANKPTISTAKSSSFCRHFLNMGNTGCGKSVTLFGIQDELLRIGKNYVSLGFKRDGRHRIRQVSNLLVFIISQNANFGWNITIPPKGVNQKDWDLTWCRIFCETQNLSLGMESMLLEFVEKLRKKNDVITIEMLYREIKEAGFKAFRNVNWQASLVNRLEALCRFNKMLNTSKPFPLEKLVENYSIEFELDDAGEFKSTFATLISVHPYKYRIANNLRGNELWIAIFCDEGLFIGSKEIQRSCFLGEPMLFSLIRLAREFGIGFVLATSESTSLSDTIKSNCYTQVFMGSNRFGEVLEFGRNANATKEQLEFIPKLLQGQGIMKMGNLNLFPITFPYVEIKKDVSESEINEQNTRLLHGTEFESVIKPELELIVAEESESKELKTDEKAFLWSLYNQQYLSVKERIDSLNISASKFYSIMNSLKRKCAAKEYVANLGGRGGLTTFLEITKEGCEAIGVKQKPHLTRGGNFITDVFVMKLSDNLRKILTHCKVSLEKQVQGKFCDIVVEGINQSFIIAVEVELSDANLKVNIEKDSERADFLIEACIGEQLVKKAEEIVKAMPREKQIKIEICLLTKLMRCQKLSDVVDSDFLKEKGL